MWQNICHQGHRQWHIVAVPLNNVHNIADLYHTLYREKINKKKIPMDRRLYILEYIDCCGLVNIFQKRKDIRVKKETLFQDNIFIQKEKEKN